MIAGDQEDTTSSAKAAVIRAVQVFEALRFVQGNPEPDHSIEDALRTSAIQLMAPRLVDTSHPVKLRVATNVVVWWRSVMECSEAGRLLDEYMKALRAFHAVQEPLLAGAGPGDPAYNRARIDREEALVALTRVRGMYWKHVQMHGCRSGLSDASRQKEIRARLHTDLLEARRRLDGALVEYRRLTGIAQDVAGTRDGAFALQQAKNVQMAADKAYRSALSRFTNFVSEGIVPEDMQGRST